MKKFTLPNLRQKKEQIYCNYIFNQKSYKCKFVWTGDYCLADIYLPQDSGNKYIVKGLPIIPDVDLISRVKTSDLIEGKLFIKNKFGKNINPDIYNFHTDFELVYYEKDELSE